jgi:hypothetical protein
MQEDHARRAPGGGLIESHVTTVWQALSSMVLKVKGRAADRLCPLLLLVLFWTHPCNTGIIPPLRLAILYITSLLWERRAVFLHLFKSIHQNYFVTCSRRSWKFFATAEICSDENSFSVERVRLMRKRCRSLLALLKDKGQRTIPLPLSSSHSLPDGRR